MSSGFYLNVFHLCVFLFQGLDVQGQQEVNPWDIWEGQKGGPLAWSWFGAVRHERKPLFYGEQSDRMVFHHHNKAPPLAAYQSINVNLAKNDQVPTKRASLPLESDSSMNIGHGGLVPPVINAGSGYESTLMRLTPTQELRQPGSRLTPGVVTSSLGAYAQTGGLVTPDLAVNPPLEYQHHFASTNTTQVSAAAAANSLADGLQQQQLFAHYQQEREKQRRQDSLRLQSRPYLTPGQVQQQAMLQQSQHHPSQQSQHHPSQQIASSGVSAVSAIPSGSFSSAPHSSAPSGGLYQRQLATDRAANVLGTQAAQLTQPGNVLVSPSTLPGGIQLIKPEGNPQHHIFVQQQQQQQTQHSQQHMASQAQQQQYSQFYRRP